MKLERKRTHRLNVGKKPESAKSIKYTGKDEKRRDEYIRKITGKKSSDLKVMG